METLQRTANRGSVSTGYNIDNSCKFEADNSEKLSRSQTTGTNRKKFTVSFWVKRTEIGAFQVLAIAEGSGNDISFLDFESDDFLRFRDTASASDQCILETNRVFRDSSAWYHIVLRVDTTLSTADDRARIYVNGVQETSFSTRTNFDQNDDTFWGYNGGSLTWGNALGEANYYSGYVAEAVYVDGQSLAPTSFGEVDDDTGIWKPIDVSSLTFGNNGYYLDFEDGSNMGNDASGGTDFSETNITAADQATDTPTNNFCTLLGEQQASVVGTEPSIKEGGTTMFGGVSGTQNAIGTMGVRNGKWYFESTITDSGGVGTENHNFGVASTEEITTWSTGSGHDIGYISTGWACASNSAPRNNNATATNANATGALAVDKIMGVAIDMDNGKIWWHREGTWTSINSTVGNPANGTAPAFSNLLTATTEHLIPAGGFYVNNGNQIRVMNFGGYAQAVFTAVGTYTDANGYGSFAYQPPTGYYALCTKNLAEYG